MEYISFIILSLYASSYFSIAIYLFSEDICKFGIKLYESNIQNYLISGGIRTITAYSTLKNNISTLKNDIYTCHPYITYTIDIISYIKCLLHANIYDYNIEPFDLIWVKQCVLINNDRDDEIDMKIYYSYFFVNKTTGNDILNFYKTFNTAYYFIENSLQKNINKDVLLIGKYNDIYVSRVHKQSNSFGLDINNFTQRSNVSFLSVSLIIPHQQPIDIIIDKNMFYVNNELLSKAFIKRYLDHHNIKVKFSDNYTVEFMDDNINMVTLKSNEHVILQLNEYTIHKQIENGN
jgi:hypothetical protein